MGRASRADYFRQYRKNRGGRDKRTVKGYYTKFLYQAKKRGMDATLTLDEFAALSSQACFYCGGALPPDGHGLDRVNSKVGYVIGNVVSCCKVCNIAKAGMSQDEFRLWILQVSLHWANPKN
jgi:hypothetical protein